MQIKLLSSVEEVPHEVRKFLQYFARTKKTNYNDLSYVEGWGQLDFYVNRYITNIECVKCNRNKIHQIIIEYLKL